MKNEMVNLVEIAIVVIPSVFLITLFCILLKDLIKSVGLDGLRAYAYELFLSAEHTFRESGSGEKKMQYVIDRIWIRMPVWMRFFLTKKMIRKIVQHWFDMIKDLLDDGKINRSFRYR